MLPLCKHHTRASLKKKAIFRHITREISSIHRISIDPANKEFFYCIYNMHPRAASAVFHYPIAPPCIGPEKCTRIPGLYHVTYEKVVCAGVTLLQPSVETAPACARIIAILNVYMRPFVLFARANNSRARGSRRLCGMIICKIPISSKAELF